MFSLGPRTAVSALGSEEKDTGSGTVSSLVEYGGDNSHTWKTYLDLPKGAEWMIRGAYTPSFRIKQHPLEHAGRKHHFFRQLDCCFFRGYVDGN